MALIIISRPYYFSVSLLITLIMMILDTTSPTPNYLYHDCSNDTIFKPKSKYNTNLNTVFHSLSSNSTNPGGFSTASAATSSNSSAVYGLFLCRGDQNTTACQDCVTTATTTDLPRKFCRNRKEAIIWYDECTVRYSNRSFFGTMDESPGQLFFNVRNITGNLTRFTEVLGEMMDNVADRAARGGRVRKFATEVASFTSLQTLYALGQCTPDLKASDCSECLITAIGYLPLSIGGRILMPSCNVRYEIYPFFNGATNLTSLSLSPSPAPAPSPEGDSTGLTPATGSSYGRKNVQTKVILAIIVPVAAIISTLLVVGICLIKNKKSKKYDDSETGEDFTTVESLQYELGKLQSATNDFSHLNKLGEGGFGGVYKGTLNGKEIAVKRLSKSSFQGVQEFKNEVLLVAKLQHRNLVRLLGFCVDGDEKLLIYEYVPNKSLDYVLFDPEKRAQLNWGMRYKIIGGIARGMLYLHQDSRLRIVHRDLKASNVLLDADMNPKISDFGMARIFGEDETQGNTSRIVGTYGYMSPEYAMHGQFSDKSDVYSFGVLVLEIISGLRNSSVHQQNDAQDLLSNAWKQWRNSTPLEFVDPTIRDSCSIHEVLRCIHLGLLCVQESVDDRPTMATIVLTLDSYSVTLSVPKQPDFSMKSKAGQLTLSALIGSDNQISTSTSITEIEPR